MKHILIVEDDRNIVDILEINLKDAECNLHFSTNGKEALAIARRESLDLIILDLMLPDSNGLEICRELREKDNSTPILMLTAMAEEHDKINGLESGADDYMTKPFSIKELQARVRSVFRRGKISEVKTAKDVSMLTFDGLEIQLENWKLIVRGKKVELSPKEFDLLTLFASHPGRSFTREKILNLVWGHDFEGFEHTVNSHINRLRSKIEEDISKPKYILTTWGIGYRFSEEV